MVASPHLTTATFTGTFDDREAHTSPLMSSDETFAYGSALHQWQDSKHGGATLESIAAGIPDANTGAQLRARNHRLAIIRLPVEVLCVLARDAAVGAL